MSQQHARTFSNQYFVNMICRLQTDEAVTLGENALSAKTMFDDMVLLGEMREPQLY